MNVNVILFTDNYFLDNFFIRGNGAYRIATEIRNAGYTCQVIDFFGFLTETDIEKIIEKYVDEDTYVVGFSSTFFTPSTEQILTGKLTQEEAILKRQKYCSKLSFGEIYSVKYPYKNETMNEILFSKIVKKNKNIKFVYGGCEAQHQDAFNIDCHFVGTQDTDIVDYLSKIKQSLPLPSLYNSIGQNKFDFNHSQILWHESDHIFPNETLPIETARGCIFKCKFCNYQLNGKKQFDYIKNPETLKEEFIRNYELFGTTQYIFGDDTFNDSTYKLELFYNNVMSKLPFKLEFATYLRLDLINAHREQIQLLKEMGLKFSFFGIESINAKSLQIIGKSLTQDKMENIMMILKDEWGTDILTTGSFIYGLPGETKETLEYFEKWLIEDSLNYFNHIQILPLYLHMSDSTTQKSELSIDFKSYGYKQDETKKHINIWVSVAMGINYTQATSRVNNILSIIQKDKRYLHCNGLAGIGLNNIGISFDDIKNNQYYDIDLSAAVKNYADKIKSYKNKILQ